MIEWIVGAALLVGHLFGSSRQDRAGISTLPSPSPSPSEDNASKQANWRDSWQASVDRTRWIPKSAVSNIVEKFPPPARSWSFFGSSRDHAERDLLAEFATHNAEYLLRQKERLKPFFETVETNPLTDEQMDACICMDDTVQVVAAAGSGKTSTIVSKVGYALHESLYEPGQIVVLAFNREVAHELQKRLQHRLGEQDGVDRVTVKTFNAFGLSVIGAATGRKPSLAEWAEPGRDIEKIIEIVSELRQRSKAFRRDWDMFRTIFGRSIEPGEKSGILTAKGHGVKSEESAPLRTGFFIMGSITATNSPMHATRSPISIANTARTSTIRRLTCTTSISAQ